MDRCTTPAPRTLDERREARIADLTARFVQAKEELDTQQAEADAFRTTARAQVRRSGMHLVGGAGEDR
jgi:hypothetical protein